MSDNEKLPEPTSAPPAADPDELTDADLEKVSGGGAVVEDRQLRPSGGNLNLDAGLLKGWGDPH